MTINSRIRLGLLASAVALAFAAPTAFAQAGKTAGGLHTDPGATPDAPAAVHTQAVMKKSASSGVARDAGKTVGGLHSDPGGTPDAPVAVHTQEVMKKQSSATTTVIRLSTPAY